MRLRPTTQRWVHAAIIMGLAAFVLWMVAGCAPRPDLPPEAQPTALDYACTTYATNLEAAADYIRAGLLTAEQITQLNEARAVISPICSDLDNVAPADAASSLAAVRRAILQLEAMGVGVAE